MPHTPAPKVAGFIVLLIATMVPGILLTLAGLPAAGSAASLGAIGGATAIISATRRQAAWAALAMGAAVFLATSTAPVPFLAVTAFVLIGAFTGLLNFRGLSAAFLFVPMCAGFALTQPSVLTPNVVVNALFIGVVTAGAAVLPVLLMPLIAKSLPRVPVAVFPQRVVLGYATNLAFLLGLTSFITLTFALNHLGSWLILTVVVIVQPLLQVTWNRGLHRAVGTILGFFIAVGVAGSIPLPGLFFAIGNLFIVIAIAQRLRHRPYWQYAMFLTPGIVLLDGTSASILSTADDRLFATFVGALICLIVLGLERPFFKAAAARAGVAHY